MHRLPNAGPLRLSLLHSMKLDVLNSEVQESVWYSEGLAFTCSQCGNCCTGPPGYVWISQEEIGRLAEFLKMSAEEVIKRFCRRFGDRLSLKERKTPQGQYDCIFLKESDETSAYAGSKRKFCSIYSVRPLQCRTWPFWPENLNNRQSWNHAAKRCHGMNSGKRVFGVKEIHAIRDASDWPDNPPTSTTRK